ncbi:cyclic-phosphate processing receiver domain-containing protein [Aeromonas caviae]|uniref:cyclic-phosphate processing receiver domain-containing protein n=1 Tax=Aeromonas TaxID=642 RepID=UPI0031FD7225
MKLYLDDERKTPVGWVRVFWPDEAIAWLETETVTEISLDHDLGDDDRGTGYDVILWIENEVMTNNFIPPKIHIHSANVSARRKMELGIMAINRFLGNST